MEREREINTFDWLPRRRYEDETEEGGIWEEKSWKRECEEYENSKGKKKTEDYGRSRDLYCCSRPDLGGVYDHRETVLSFLQFLNRIPGKDWDPGIPKSPILSNHSSCRVIMIAEKCIATCFQKKIECVHVCHCTQQCTFEWLNQMSTFRSTIHSSIHLSLSLSAYVLSAIT